jgi:hypothetical protein
MTQYLFHYDKSSLPSLKLLSHRLSTAWNSDREESDEAQGKVEQQQF